MAGDNSMILVIDPANGRIIEGDHEAMKMYGCQEPEELTVLAVPNLHPAITLETLRKVQQSRDLAPAHFCFTFRGGSGRIHDLDARLYGLQSIGSSYVLAVIHDVTDSWAQEKNLKDAHEILEQRVQERTAELLQVNEQLRREISQRQRAEAARRTSEMKYSNLVENSLMGIHINVHGRIVFANHRFAEIHGYPRDELIGMEIQRLIHPDDRDMILDYMNRRFHGQEAPQEYEARGWTKDGRSVWLVRNTVRIYYQGKPAILGNTLDISARKAMEQSLRASEKQLHALSAQLLTAQERERERVAHELHDGIGQYLTAIKFRLENACRQLLTTTANVDVEPLRSIVPVIQEAVEEVRRISMDLRPSILDDLGIGATLDWYFREFQTTHPGLALDQHIVVSEQDVPDLLKLVIYRLVQEGLHNIVKHSGAKRVRIQLAARNGLLELLIQDDGQGFDLARLAQQNNSDRGFGLAGMKKRAELSGGELQIDSEPTRGTKLWARWKIR